MKEYMENFKTFIPIEIIEKGKTGDDGLPEELVIAGVASSMKSGRKDKDGQILDVSGFNFQPFLKSGFFNLEHRGRDDYANIIGEPTDAFVKDGEFHVQGRLYKENPKAVSVYKLAQVLKKSGSTRTIGYSIEGRPTAFDPRDKSIIKSADITGIALTISPKCDGTRMEIIKGGDFEYENQEGSELLLDITDNGVRYTVDNNLEITKSVVDDEIEKGGVGSGRKRIKVNSPMASHSNLHGKTFDVHKESEHEFASGKKKYYHIKDEDGDEHEIREDFAEVQKAIVAGSITGTETTNQALTGEPLKPESVEGSQGKKKKKAKIKNLISKGEVFTMLIKDHNLDATSCKRVWHLIQEIEKADQVEVTIEKGGVGSGRHKVYLRGGAIGEKRDTDHPKYGRLQSEHESLDEAKDKAKRYNKMLSPGEKSYYKLKYHVVSE